MVNRAPYTGQGLHVRVSRDALMDGPASNEADAFGAQPGRRAGKVARTGLSPRLRIRRFGDTLVAVSTWIRGPFPAQAGHSPWRPRGRRGGGGVNRNPPPDPVGNRGRAGPAEWMFVGQAVRHGGRRTNRSLKPGHQPTAPPIWRLRFSLFRLEPRTPWALRADGSIEGPRHDGGPPASSSVCPGSIQVEELVRGGILEDAGLRGIRRRSFADRPRTGRCLPTGFYSYSERATTEP